MTDRRRRRRSIAGRIQRALHEQTVRDLERRGREVVEHGCTVVTCERARFWRDRYESAVDEIEDVHRRMRQRGIRLY